MKIKFNEIFAKDKLEQLVKDLHSVEPIAHALADEDKMTADFFVEYEVKEGEYPAMFRRVSRNIKKFFPKAQIIQDIS